MPVSLLPELARLFGLAADELLELRNGAGKRGLASKFQKQLKRIAQLPRARQEVVIQISTGSSRNAPSRRLAPRLSLRTARRGGHLVAEIHEAAVATSHDARNSGRRGKASLLWMGYQGQRGLALTFR